jgi:hypothetical protein
MRRLRILFAAAGIVVVSIGWLLTWQLARPTAPGQPPKTDEPAPTTKSFEFPAGGRKLLPGYQLIAIYGSPNEPLLGLLGQQDAEDTVRIVKAWADQYQPLINKPIYPAFEMVATIASCSPTDNGDYSRELDLPKLQAWIDVARTNGIYVILDLQPGRTDFLTQAKEYEPLLERPNVGMALDPEWRLAPSQFHLQQIGHGDITEVNTVISWLAELTKQHDLPQKAFVLHEFRPDMITNRHQLDTSHTDQLAYIIHVDGQGSQAAKASTWASLQQNPPVNIHWGWKNFTQQDKPMLTPAATTAIQPQPELITYQ